MQKKMKNTHFRCHDANYVLLFYYFCEYKQFYVEKK